MGVLDLLELLVVELVALTVPLIVELIYTFLNPVKIILTLADTELCNLRLRLYVGCFHLCLALFVAYLNAILQHIVAIVINLGHGYQNITHILFRGSTIDVGTFHLHRLNLLLKFRMYAGDTIGQRGQILIEFGDDHKAVVILFTDGGAFLQILYFAFYQYFYWEQGHFFCLHTKIHQTIGKNGIVIAQSIA